MIDPATPKRCKTCGETKPRSEFSPSGPSVHPSCRPCSNLLRRADRAANPAVHRAYSAKYNDGNREKVRKKWREWARKARAEDPTLYPRLKEYRKRTGWRPTRARPEVANARNAVCRAIKRGILVKPDACSRCGAGGPIEGHHEDYAKRLEVVWLCKRCHGLISRVEARTKGVDDAATAP